MTQFFLSREANLNTTISLIAEVTDRHQETRTTAGTFGAENPTMATTTPVKAMEDLQISKTKELKGVCEAKVLAPPRGRMF